MMKRIAIYSHSIAPSIDGVCRRFTGILHEMQRQGLATLLFTMEDVPLDLPSSTEFVTLDHIIFPTYPNKKVAWATVKSFWAIVTKLKAFRPDVIHVVADGFSQMFALAGSLLGIPVVGSFHTDILDLLSTHGAWEVQKLCVRSKEAVDSIVLDSCATTSTSFQAKLATQGVHCEHVIITAVDVDIFNTTRLNKALRRELMFLGEGEEEQEGDLLCVYVGRISNEKRLDLVLDAMGRLDGPGRAFLAIVGDGPSAPAFARLHGKEHRVYCQPRFLSHAELAEVYASCDVHVSASEFETLGNTVLEAFACGIPVVVPRTQGFRDTVRHEVDGFLFNPADVKDATDYLNRMKNDAVSRKRMGNEGCKAVNSRSVKYVVADLLQWYERGRQTALRRRGQLFYRVLVPATLMLLVPFTIGIFCFYNITVAALKPFVSFGEYTVTAAAADSPLLCKERDGNSEISKLSSGGSKKQA